MSTASKAMLGAAVITTVALGLLARGQARIDAEQEAERTTALVAQGVAWAAAGEQNREDDEAEGLTQRFVEAARARVTGLESAMVLKGTKILASSDPSRAGKRLSSDDLGDKDLFDAAKRLKALVRKNVEERERNPKLGRDAYPQRELERHPAPGGAVRLDARVPVLDEAGDFHALARVELLVPPSETPLPWGALLLGLLAAAIFFPIGLKLRGAPAVAVGSALLAASLVAQVGALTDWRAERRRASAASRAVSCFELAEAGLLGVALGANDALPAQLTRTAAGHPAGDLIVVRSATVGAAAIEGGLRFERAPWEALFAESWFEARRAEDRANLGLWALGIGALALAFFVLGALGLLTRGLDSFLEHRYAYQYMSPAMAGMLVLVFVPVVFGIVLGFLQRRYNVFEFAGLANYIAILSDFDVQDPQNFYFKLGVTIMWTVMNVALHVGIGLFLAILLNDQMLKAKGVFRVLLVVPWAIPNYITALIWKGMFHKQFGAVNFFLEAMGSEPIAWFQSFWPAFFTNLATNTWLGFPFMMVVSLGALQSIPADLYEAARVDGASRWQRFRSITLPLLMPALVPAVIMGAVWTFNMFNIIYLVSGGAPNGATDILITDAFRWAFERDRYGYAAAYSTIIFVILLLFTLATNRITGATKGAFE